MTAQLLALAWIARGATVRLPTSRAAHFTLAIGFAGKMEIPSSSQLLPGAKALQLPICLLFARKVRFPFVESQFFWNHGTKSSDLRVSGNGGFTRATVVFVGNLRARISRRQNLGRPQRQIGFAASDHRNIVSCGCLRANSSPDCGYRAISWSSHAVLRRTLRRNIDDACILF